VCVNIHTHAFSDIILKKRFLKVIMRQTPTPTPTKNKISDYTEVSTIGRGAFGSVVEARYVRTGDRVALKRVSMRDEKRIAVTLIREIRTMRQCIDHPNIVKFIDAFADGKSLVLVMKKMECDLNVLLRSLKEPLPPNLSKAYLRMILLATNYLHSKDLIHRDIKPSNIMISSSGVLKLGDFGLARVLSHSSRRLTPQVSTRWYRSPEVLFGSKTYGFGTDMWSVGCVFAELLTLEPLFSGDNDFPTRTRLSFPQLKYLLFLLLLLLLLLLQIGLIFDFQIQQVLRDLYFVNSYVLIPNKDLTQGQHYWIGISLWIHYPHESPIFLGLLDV